MRRANASAFIPSLSQERRHSARASASARSFISSPACPLTQCHSTSCRSDASSSRRQSSTFLTGFLSAFSIRAAFHPAIHWSRRCAHIANRCGDRPRKDGSTPPARRSRPSVPCGCCRRGLRRPKVPSRARRIAGSRPYRMELMAAIVALEALTRPCAVDLHTDSQYVRNGVTSGSPDGRRADGKPPTESRSRTSSFGGGSKRRPSGTRSNGIGSGARRRRNERAGRRASAGGNGAVLEKVTG